MVVRGGCVSRPPAITKWYQISGSLCTQVSARFAFSWVQFSYGKDGSEYQQNDIIEWYKLSSLKEKNEWFAICKGIPGRRCLMSTHFYSCRHLLGLQVQRFVEQHQVSLKWITQGLSNSGRKRSKLSLSSNPAITIQKVSCVPNTSNTLVRCIGALVRWRDSEIQVV
jgi:hypothetical protein